MEYNTGIYQIINRINGKRYIGSAIDLKRRQNQHFFDLKNKKHYNSYLQRAYNKHGELNFKFEILLYCNKENLFFYEQRMVNAYKFKKELYNLHQIVNSPLGIKRSKETRKKLSDALKGKKKSIEQIEKMANFFRGKKLSLEHKKKIRKAQIGIPNAKRGHHGENHPRYGLHGEKNPQSKAIYQIDKKTNKIIKKWESQINIQKILKIDASSISKACRKKIITVGGFRWAFVNNYNPFKIRKDKRWLKRIDVYQINIHTNKIIKKWNGLRIVEKKLKISSADISRCCNNKRNEAGGFKWKYANKKITGENNNG